MFRAYRKHGLRQCKRKRGEEAEKKQKCTGVLKNHVEKALQKVKGGVAKDDDQDSSG